MYDLPTSQFASILFTAVLCVVLWLLVQCSRLSCSQNNEGTSNQEHATAESQILAEVELKLLEFKREQELRTENRVLNHKLSLLAEDKQLNQETIKDLKAEKSLLAKKLEKTKQELERKAVALEKELRLQDKKIIWFQNQLKLAEKKLKGTNNELEETNGQLSDACTQLEHCSVMLKQERDQSESVKMKLKETLKETRAQLSIEKENANILRGDLKVCEQKLMNEEYQKRLVEKKFISQIQDLKTRLRGFDEGMRQSEQEKDKLKQQVVGYDTQLKVMKVRVNDCRNALDSVLKEKKEMITKHKTVFEKFEESFKDLDMCTERLKKVS